MRASSGGVSGRRRKTLGTPFSPAAAMLGARPVSSMNSSAATAITSRVRPSSVSSFWK